MSSTYGHLLYMLSVKERGSGKSPCTTMAQTDASPRKKSAAYEADVLSLGILIKFKRKPCEVGKTTPIWNGPFMIGSWQTINIVPSLLKAIFLSLLIPPSQVDFICVPGKGKGKGKEKGG